MKHLVNGSLKQAIQDLLVAADDEKLMEFLNELQPFDIATLLVEFEEPDQLKILRLSDPDIAAETLEHLDYDEQYRLLDHSPDNVTRDLLARMSDDAVADLVMAIHPPETKRFYASLQGGPLQASRLMRHIPPILPVVSCPSTTLQLGKIGASTV